jgi:hypothetical protein
MRGVSEILSPKIILKMGRGRRKSNRGGEFAHYMHIWK